MMHENIKIMSTLVICLIFLLVFITPLLYGLNVSRDVAKVCENNPRCIIRLAAIHNNKEMCNEIKDEGVVRQCISFVERYQSEIAKYKNSSVSVNLLPIAITLILIVIGIGIALSFKREHTE
ncbi:MAG TPA: hypothetical protein ENG42_01500 [Candidatus Aenigmarchaeota archaeon]|nr:hypothetical protein [Candidatus Aenigmarchaeota archaeon]